MGEQLFEKKQQGACHAGDCLSLKTLAVTGNDLIEAGIKPGKEIGLHLARMLDDVLEHPEHNTREYLLYSVLT